MSDVSLFSLLSRRRGVFSSSTSDLSELYPILYKHMQANKMPEDDNYPYGSVFNIEFSPSDKLALTVCSSKSIAGYDPRVRVAKTACAVTGAHSDCVNCVTFLDDFMFATCSDDKTICLWDLRNLRSSLYTLHGHGNWIKNIEYDRKTKKLFSVAFFEGVREWEIGALDQYIRNGEPNNLVIELSDPIRMRISPDGSKMFISTRNNLCCFIDRFDGNTLSDVKPMVHELFQKQQAHQMEECDLRRLRHNRPSVHTMSRLQDCSNSFRAVMSMEFHPCCDIVALRHVDVEHQHYSRESSTLYDLRMSGENYRPYCSSEQTSRRYLKYAEECSTDDTVDFIKEFCFSRDGLVLASPHQSGVRLLAMDSCCTPVEVYNDDRFCDPHELHKRHDFEVVKTISGDCITSPVLSCRFARHDCLLATGGYSGQFLFHMPRL